MDKSTDRFIFRAWHPEWSKMVYSTSLHDWFGKREFVPFQFEVGFSHYPKDDRWEITQCTGLHDKNGEQIFEGDIVRDADSRDMRVGYSTHFQQMRLFPISENCDTILGMSKQYGVEIFSWTYPEMLLTIVGNIYEPPHTPEEQE